MEKGPSPYRHKGTRWWQLTLLPTPPTGSGAQSSLLICRELALPAQLLHTGMCHNCFLNFFLFHKFLHA